MTNRNGPESLKGRWDILYRDYPEVYEEFESIPKVPDLIDVLAARFPLQGKTVVDVGSGTGISTFKLARYAAQVIGIEIEEAMIAIAQEKARACGIQNVRFQLGDAEHLPFEDDSNACLFFAPLRLRGSRVSVVSPSVLDGGRHPGPICSHLHPDDDPRCSPHEGSDVRQRRAYLQ
jgi:SAM-dependent methyltransferase